MVHPVPIDRRGVNGPTPQNAKSQDWRRTSLGMYVPASVDPTLPEQRVAEVAARLIDGAAVTGWGSLLMHGGNHFDGLGKQMQPLPVPVAVPLPRDISRWSGLTKLRAPLTPAEIVIRQGVPVTTPMRALMDAMTRAADWRTAAVHASVATSAGLVDLRAFEKYVADLSCISGIVKVRRALEYVDDRVRSPPEAELFQVWCIDAGLPRPLMNWPIYDAFGIYLGAVDLLCPPLDLAGDYDSEEHADSEARDTDAGRDVKFRSVGLTTFRIGKQVFRNPKRRLERIHQAVAIAERSTVPPSYVLGKNPEPVVNRELRRMGLLPGNPGAY